MLLNEKTNYAVATDFFLIFFFFQVVTPLLLLLPIPAAECNAHTPQQSLDLHCVHINRLFCCRNVLSLTSMVLCGV